MTYLLGAIISSVLYRLGGSVQTKFRDFGVPLVLLIVLPWHLTVFVSVVLLFGALTTYWDWIDGKDNFYLHGLGCGLALFPVAMTAIHPWMLVPYTALLSLVMGQVNYWANRMEWPYRDYIEEMSRGFVIIAFLPLLFM